MPGLVNFQAKDFVLCLLVAGALAAALITAAIVNPPWLHVLPARWQEFLLLTFLLLIGAVHQYRHAWTSKGYWALLSVSFGLHSAAWVSVLSSIQTRPSPLIYILFAAIEAVIFSAAAYWLLGILPPINQETSDQHRR
jgi:hypothetical protein